MSTGAPYVGLATTFDSVAELYEHARPGYPPELFADLAALTGAGPGSRVLEIGPGTGQATRGLLGLGWKVVGLEPGPQLARTARRVLAGRGEVDVVEAPFELWDDAGAGPFDVVLAATSWHWLDPDVALPKAARLLRPGGTLAIVSTEHVLPRIGGDPFFEEVDEAYRAVGMSDRQGGPPPPEQVRPPDLPAIEASGHFGPPVTRRYLWDRSYTATEYLEVLSTYSGHIAASSDQRRRLFADIRRRIERRTPPAVRKHYLNILQLARRGG